MAVQESATETPPPIGSRLGEVLIKICAGTLTLICVLWVLDLPFYLGIVFFREQFLAIVLGLVLAVVFLSVAANRRQRKGIPWYDVLAAVVGFLTPVYLAVNLERLLIAVGDITPETIVIGVIFVVLVMEGLRRATGYPLFVIVSLFIAYSFIGEHVPGRLKALPVELDELFVYLAFDPTAIFGTPMVIGAEVVVAFILFGQFLLRAGGGEFFTDLAMAVMGRQRGGGAKISVLASALFGSISGSAVSNVASTGVITIPLMRRSGYTDVQAGAIEAVASTGGQFMPPIMGAAAFLMAEFLEIAYTDVIVAALVPALLYYLAVFIQVDLMAARDKVKTVATDIPRVVVVLKSGGHFLVPFAVLLVGLFQFTFEPQEAVIYAVAATAILGLARRYKGHRLTPGDLVASFWVTGQIVTELLLILGAAGFVIGILNITGFGFALTLFLVEIGGGNLAMLVLLAAVTCIILGMGMPTSGVYVLLAALVAPALVEAGAGALQAHMFILYFGMMSMITPPIALAAFTAAAMTGANPMKTGFEAVKLGWVAYVIPIMFILSPTLLLDGQLGRVAIDVLTAVIGVYYFSVGVVGYFFSSLSVLLRMVLVLLGLATLLPMESLDNALLLSGLATILGIVILLWNYVAARRVSQATS